MNETISSWTRSKVENSFLLDSWIQEPIVWCKQTWIRCQDLCFSGVYQRNGGNEI